MITIAADNTITIEILPADAGKQIQGLSRDLERLAGIAGAAADAFQGWIIALEGIAALGQVVDEQFAEIGLGTGEGLVLLQEWRTTLEGIREQVQLIGNTGAESLELWIQQVEAIRLSVGEIALGLEEMHTGSLEALELVGVSLEEIRVLVDELIQASLEALAQINLELEQQLQTMNDMALAFGSVWNCVDMELLLAVNAQLTEMLETMSAIGQAVTAAFESVDMELVLQLDAAILEIGLKLDRINQSLGLTAEHLVAIGELVDGVTASIWEMALASEEWVLALNLEAAINGFAMLLEAIDLTVESLRGSMEEIVAIIDEGVEAIALRVSEGVESMTTTIATGVEQSKLVVEAGFNSMSTIVGLNATKMEQMIDNSFTNIQGRIKRGCEGWYDTIRIYTEMMVEIASRRLEAIGASIDGLIDNSMKPLNEAVDSSSESFDIWKEIIDTVKIAASIFTLVLGAAAAVISGPLSLGVIILTALMSALIAIVVKVTDVLRKFGREAPKYGDPDLPPGATEPLWPSKRSVALPLEGIPIPKLATGAVIPPNNEFLAILGDQRSGRNLETPEGLMRDIFRQELAQLHLPAPTVTLNAQGGMGELIRLLFPHLEQERARIGQNLVAGAL